MWYTYVGEDGWVHREGYEVIKAGEDMIDAWDDVRNSEDQREINKFLWQNCQDSLEIIRNQLGVLEVLSNMLDDQEAYIQALEEETRDVYGD
jgi:hypothetical protein